MEQSFFGVKYMDEKNLRDVQKMFSAIICNLEELNQKVEHLKKATIKLSHYVEAVTWRTAPKKDRVDINIADEIKEILSEV